jgi:hypothetical protein
MKVMSDDNGGGLTLEELKAKHPDLLAAFEAEVRAELAAKAPKPETPEERQARLVADVEAKVITRALGILAACREADRLHHAVGYVNSGKPLEVVEAELAWATGRVH